ncbi:transposase [Micromonospora sp. CPCC 206171]|uniref:transposase n=1 Tax=Micromonospora sp. CPCC 206171 TaxID=3122405 RepID=UPI003FA58825
MGCPVEVPAAGGDRPRADDRRVPNGIVWKIRPERRRDLPARYGSWQPIYTRFRRWHSTGRSSGCSPGSRPTPTRPGASTGWCRSTRPSCEPKTATSYQATVTVAALPQWL